MQRGGCADVTFVTGIMRKIFEMVRNATRKKSLHVYF